MESVAPIYRSHSAGKLILCGEHSVVYGHPAIACAIDQALTTEIYTDLKINGIDFDFQILQQSLLYQNEILQDDQAFEARQQSLLLDQVFDQRLILALGKAFELLEIIGSDVDLHHRIVVKGALPIGVGLGSSASLSISLIKALAFLMNQPLDHQALDIKVLALEKQFHFNPSGLDQYVIMHGGAWQFQKQANKNGSPYQLLQIKLGKTLNLVISWVPRTGDSKTAVLMVKEHRQRYTALYDGIFEQISKLVSYTREALVTGDIEALGVIFQLNHGYLNACGLSNASIEKIIEIAKQNGAIASKLTGAGLGGAVLMICEEKDQERLCLALQRENFPAFPTKIEQG